MITSVSKISSYVVFNIWSIAAPEVAVAIMSVYVKLRSAAESPSISIW